MELSHELHMHPGENPNTQTNLFRRIILKKASPILSTGNNEFKGNDNTICKNDDGYSIESNLNIPSQTNETNSVKTVLDSTSLVDSTDFSKKESIKTASEDVLNNQPETKDDSNNSVKPDIKKDEKIDKKKSKKHKDHHKKSKKEHKHRSKSKKRRKDRSKSRSRSRSRSKSRSRSRSRSKDRSRSRSSHSKSNSERISIKKSQYIDKKYSEIEASKNNIKNLLEMHNKSIQDNLKKIASNTYSYLTKPSNDNSKKSVNEFVEYCKKLSSNDKDTSPSNYDQETSNYTLNRQISSRSHQESDEHQKISILNETVTKIFPVSSGSQHRRVELENKDRIDGKFFVRQSIVENTNSTPENMQIALVDDPRFDRSYKEKVIAEHQAVINEQMLGKFTGTTDTRFLTPEELEGEFKAWTKKDLLTNATPISGGIGKKLLEKMGWQPGQGLGKHKEGPVEPVAVDIKTNRKGLWSQVDNLKNKTTKDSPIVQHCEGKHPVSSLLELCKARKWPDPIFEVVSETGPPHMRNFLMRVILNNNVFQPNNPSPNKKLAKAEASLACLQALGFVNPSKNS